MLSFTFDDGYDEHYTAAELMAPYGFRGTAYVIPDSIGDEGYVTMHDLVDMQDTFGWDIAAHHAIPFTDMRPAQLENSILATLRYLRSNQFTRAAGHLAYPLGKQNTALVRPMVRKHFTTARIAASGPETLPPADPHLLRTYNVVTATTPAELKAAAEQAIENKQWLILMFHWLVDDPQYDTQYSIKDFKKVLAKIKQTGIRVLPLTEAWEACAGHTGLGGCQIESAIASKRARDAGQTTAAQCESLLEEAGAEAAAKLAP